jgi:hypothetical protein
MSSTITKLGDLVNKVSSSVKYDLLCSSFVFPRTASLQNNEPCISLVVAPNGDLATLDFGRIKEMVNQHTEAIALSAREDLSLLLAMMDQVNEWLMLDKFDTIQVYRGGLDLLSISIPGNKTSRSAYFEINDYRRRILAYLESADAVAAWVGPLVAFIAAGALVALGSYLQRR